MRVFNFVAIAVAASIGTALIACAAPDSCFRFSDCAQGFTCADNHCVRVGEVEPAPLEEMPADPGPDAAKAPPKDAAADAKRDSGPADAGTDAGNDTGADAPSGEGEFDAAPDA